MTSLLISWILNAVALYVTASVVPGLSVRDGANGFVDCFVGALILAVANKIIKPLLLILTLPINILTLGLFTFVIIGFTFWLMTVFVPGIKAHGFIPCMIGAVVFGVLGWILHLFLK